MTSLQCYRPESERGKPFLSAVFYLQNHKTFINCQTALHKPNVNKTVIFQIAGATGAKIRKLKLKGSTDKKYYRNDLSVWSS